MCFCLCSPQTTYKSNRAVLEDLIKEHFYDTQIPMDRLIKMVRRVRFKRKAEYLQSAKDRFDDILELVKGPLSNIEKRAWLVKNIKGFGMKASSHFLRNLGAVDLSIIDTHILKFLEKPIPRNKREYLELENEFTKRAKEFALTPAELDSYIWKVYSKTPWEEFFY